jgi:putative hydrolase of the HAD superfamily
VNSDFTAVAGIAARDYDTILLDMDGTILDLAFDNYFWHELVPRCLARRREISTDAARGVVMAAYEARQGTLDWYCLDYWTTALELDIRQLKNAASHRVRYLPGARDSLVALVGAGRRVVLVTNAHQYTLAVKREVAGLDHYLSHFVSSHDFGMPKENPAFWSALQAELGFDPARTLFVDDSLAVLRSARQHGIAGVVAVSRPDSRQPVRTITEFPAVQAIAGLLG